MQIKKYIAERLVVQCFVKKLLDSFESAQVQCEEPSVGEVTTGWSG